MPIIGVSLPVIVGTRTSGQWLEGKAPIFWCEIQLVASWNSQSLLQPWLLHLNTRIPDSCPGMVEISERFTFVRWRNSLCTPRHVNSRKSTWKSIIPHTLVSHANVTFSANNNGNSQNRKCYQCLFQWLYVIHVTSVIIPQLVDPHRSMYLKRYWTN